MSQKNIFILSKNGWEKQSQSMIYFKNVSNSASQNENKALFWKLIHIQVLTNVGVSILIKSIIPSSYT